MKEKILNFFSKENFAKLGQKETWVKFFYSFIWLGILLFIIDIVTKQIVKNTMFVGQYIELIPNFLAIHYVQNEGMAFGADFGDKMANTVVFCLISIIGFIALTIIYARMYKKSAKIVKASLVLMISGCFGNLIDRCFYFNADGSHFVVDFIGFFGNPGFPRFNVADSCLTIGCIMLAIYYIVEEFKETKKNRKVEISETQSGKFENTNSEVNTTNTTDEPLDVTENEIEKAPATLSENGADSSESEEKDLQNDK